MCFAFRDALLLISAVTSGYLSFCSLPIRLRQSGHFLISDISKAENCLSLFQIIACKLEIIVGQNPSRETVFEIIIPPHLAPTPIQMHIQKHLIKFFSPILMLSLNLSKSFWPCLHASELLPCVWLFRYSHLRAVEQVCLTFYDKTKRNYTTLPSKYFFWFLNPTLNTFHI